MKISLDLDGVLCDLNGATLTTTHVLHRMGLIGDGDLRNVYMRALPKAHPSRFALPEDEVVIITGRLPISHEWTREWLELNGMAHYSVVCVGDYNVEAVWAGGDPDGASLATAMRKAGACQRFGVDLHIDNNPVIVRRMRELGVNAVCIRL